MSSRENWNRYQVRDVIVHHASGPSPSCEERNIATAEEWGLLKTTAVTWDGWDASAHKVPPRQFWGNKSLEVQQGDVLITKAGPRQRCGVTVYVLETPPRLMASGKMVLLRPDTNKTNAVLLASALATEECRRFLDSRTTGMADAQLNFTNELLLDTFIELPRLPQQSKIARILTTLDELIEKTEALIAKYQAIKQGLMHDLFTRGVDEHGHLRPSYNEAPELYKESAIGRIPHSWSIRTFDDITPKETPICYGIVQPGPYEEQGIPVVAIYNLHTDFSGCHRSSQAVESKYVRSRVRPGDVLLSVKGTTGRVDVVPPGFEGNISRDIARIRPASEASSLFLRYMLESPQYQQHLERAVVGTTRAELSIGILRRLVVALPKVDEQAQVAAALQSNDTWLNTETTQLSRLHFLKAGLMQDLLTGKVKVTADEDEATHA